MSNSDVKRAARLIFMGSPAYAVPTLDALHGAGYDIAAVYTQPPRASGRGQRPRPTPVAARAVELGLPVRSPKRLRAPDDQAAFSALGADLAVVIAYGLILPQAVLAAPKLGCVNLHASLLPRWRGAAPIQRAIMAGDTETGVCLMQMEAGLDTGPVLARRALPIAADDNAASLHDTLAALSAEVIRDTMPDLLAGVLTPQPQPAEGVTYAAKIDKDEALINWHLPASAIEAHIRGLSPYPGAWSQLSGERIKLHAADAEASPDPSAEPGTLLDDRLLVQTGDGALRITRAQRAGKQAMTAADLLRGFQPQPGLRFDAAGANPVSRSAAHKDNNTP